MLYEIMLRLPILALNLTQDGPSGQSNGPERRERLGLAVVRYKPGTRETKERVKPDSAVHFRLRARRGSQFALLYYHARHHEYAPVSAGDGNRITSMGNSNHLRRSGALYSAPHY